MLHKKEKIIQGNTRAVENLNKGNTVSLVMYTVILRSLCIKNLFIGSARQFARCKHRDNEHI